MVVVLPPGLTVALTGAGDINAAVFRRGLSMRLTTAGLTVPEEVGKEMALCGWEGVADARVVMFALVEIGITTGQKVNWWLVVSQYKSIMRRR